jgi:hypothetical protein
MADGRKNNGCKPGENRGQGRKPKAKEQELIEKLSPYDELAITQLIANVEAGENWAIRLFMEYRYGKPKQQIEQSVEFKEQPLFPYVGTNDSDKEDPIKD